MNLKDVSLSRFGKIWLLSSQTPPDFLWLRHTCGCISESGWLCARRGEVSLQLRNLPAKLFDNKTLRITHLFLLLCEEFVPKSLILHGGRGGYLRRRARKPFGAARYHLARTLQNYRRIRSKP